MDKRAFKFHKQSGLTGLELLGLAITVIVLVPILFGLAYFFWPKGGSSQSTDPEANLYLGLDTDKPSIYSVVFACRDESVGVSWRNENSDENALVPLFESGASEGFDVYPLTQTTNFRLTATNSTGQDTDVAVANVIGEAGFIASIPFLAPTEDNGLPSNLIWNYRISNVQISSNAIIDNMKIGQSPSDWPYWEVRHTSEAGNVTTYELSSETGKDVNLIDIAGTWEAQPSQLPNDPVIVAKGQLELLIRLKCKG